MAATFTAVLGTPNTQLGAVELGVGTSLSVLSSRGALMGTTYALTGVVASTAAATNT